MSESDKELELLRAELELLKWEQQDRWENPHKHYDLYDWQHEFIYNTEHIKKYGVYPHRKYLTCANQSGKTTSGLLLGHFLCTDKEFRRSHWGNNQPRVIWYMLPTQDHINDFWDEKWEPEILSKGDSKKSGPHSWDVIKKGRDIKGIYFKETQCKLMFISLAAKSSSHQGRSVGAVLFDEEPPEDRIAEIETRTASFNDPETGLSRAILAYFFTPTQAQDYFKKIFSFQDEEFLDKIPSDLKDKYFYDKQTETHRTCTLQQEKEETFKAGPTIWKRRVSMFETQKFRSGNPGRFTAERIRQIIGDQPTRKDVMVRVFAAFEKEDNGGLLYKYFDKNKHIKLLPNKPKMNLFKDGWLTAGLDYGSGSNHPGGVVITWISKDTKKVRVIRMWRGEKGKVTTAEDIVDKYLEMSQGMEIHFPFYDFSCADLNTIHWRKTGKELMKAQKNHEIGVGLVDALFKNNILKLYSYPEEPYADWAVTEYENLDHNIPKKDRLDELSDCVRYSLAGVSHLFDLEDLTPDIIEDLMIEKIQELTPKTPEDYGVRSWNNVPDEDEDNEWNEDIVGDWSHEFNGQ